MGGREPLHAIVAPAESAGKFGHGHQFQDSDPGFSQMRQFSRRAGPGAIPGERANVHFIDHLMRQGDAAPIAICPSEGARHLQLATNRVAPPVEIAMQGRDKVPPRRACICSGSRRARSAQSRRNIPKLPPAGEQFRLHQTPPPRSLLWVPRRESELRRWRPRRPPGNVCPAASLAFRSQQPRNAGRFWFAAHYQR